MTSKHTATALMTIGLGTLMYLNWWSGIKFGLIENLNFITALVVILLLHDIAQTLKEATQ